MDAVSPVPRPAPASAQAALPRETAPPEAPGPTTGTHAHAAAPLPRPAADGPATPSFDAPPLPLAVQREHLRPPEPALLTSAQMAELLSRMVVGGGAV